jgi:carbon starvation protein
VGTTVLIKMGKARFAWVTLVPLAWLAAVTFTAGWQKVLSPDPKLGFLSQANAIAAKLAAGELPAGAQTVETARRMMFNARLDAVVASVFMAVALMVIAVSMREWFLLVRKRKPAVMHEAPFVPSTLGLAGD